MSHLLKQLVLISDQIMRRVVMSGSSLKYFPLLPTILYFLIKSQLNHELYVMRKTWDKEYDYIVIGAGSAGSVMASRLSEDSAVSVLLLEAGIAETVFSDVPMNSMSLQRSPIDWNFETVPQKRACFAMNDQISFWPRGKTIGGTSTINTLVYIRGNSRDYDHWSAKGAFGWSWPEVFPYFIKSEDNKDPNYVSNGYHGVGGPMTVDTDFNPRVMTTVYLNAASELGYLIDDPNGPIQSVFTAPQLNIRDRQRLSVAKAYLEPLVDRKNLHILKKTFVTKILFDDNKRAIGVEFDNLFVRHQVMARREVIISAGVINSPKILMLSGIGPKEHLTQLGIPVISNLRVGDNLQEHVSSGIPFTINTTIGIDFSKETSVANILDYYINDNNTLSKNIDEVTAFVNSKYNNLLDDWPDIQLNMMPGTLSTDYGLNLWKIQNMKKSVWSQVFKPYIGFDTFTIYALVNRPKAKGWIRLASKDPYDPPLIDPNLFGEEQDLNVLVEGLKIALKLGLTSSLQAFDAKPFQTVFPGCEHLELYSDKYLRCLAKVYTTVGWHPCCSNKMGSKSDPSAVVDTELRVKGVKGLRVVDASVMPSIITGNTNSPTIMIAEKIADHMKGRRLKPFIPPLPELKDGQVPHLPYEEWDENLFL